MIRVAIADDHLLLLEGLSEALGGVPDLHVVGTATDGDGLVATVARLSPDVVLVDIEMPGSDGFSALREIKGSVPAIVVTMHTGDDHRRRAEAAGAAGFLSKSTPLPDLAAAIRAVWDGKDLMHDEDLQQTLDLYRQPNLDEGAAALTSREREVLKLLSSGVSSTDDLAAELFISNKTVKNHLASIYDKLAITDRAQAVVEAIRLGLHRD